MFACGGLTDTGFYYALKNFVCGGLLLFFIFQNRIFFLLLLFSQNPDEISSGSYYSTFEVGSYY